MTDKLWQMAVEPLVWSFIIVFGIFFLPWLGKKIRKAIVKLPLLPESLASEDGKPAYVVNDFTGVWHEVGEWTSYGSDQGVVSSGRIIRNQATRQEKWEGYQGEGKNCKTRYF